MPRPLFLAVAALLCATAARAEFVPNDHPELTVRRAPGAIQIDGDLNDPGWAGAARAVNWTETNPGDNVEPSVSTETWVAYDDQNLYLAFLVQDDPSTVRATLRDRDEIWQDDYVGIILDTYGTATWAYELFVNPLGVQGDLRWTTQGEDLGFDVVWFTDGRITEDGWQVEVAIPFQSLRFPDAPEQEWVATFWRNHPRDSRRRYSWAKMNRDDPCWPCNFGTLKGIEGVDSGSGWELLPSVTAYEINELETLAEGDSIPRQYTSEMDADFGIGGRYAINSSYAAQATYNPDFSQVESDAAQIDANTTFALFFPERRPFFQEGSDLFNSWVSQVYTRSINNPQWAGKLTGRQGRFSMAFLTAQDEDSPIIIPGQERSEFLLGGRSWSNILRARQNFGEDNHLGFLVTDRRLDGGGAGTTYSVDGQVRLFRNYRIEGQLTGSHTEEPDDPGLSDQIDDAEFDDGRYTADFDGETFNGVAAYASLERSARFWNFDFDYWTYSPTFRADNGFVTQNDHHRGTFWTGLFFRPNTSVLDQVTPSVSTGRIWNYDGLRKDEWIASEVDFLFKGQTAAEIRYL